MPSAAARSFRATTAFAFCLGLYAPVPAAAVTNNAPSNQYASAMRSINHRLPVGTSRLYAAALLDNARRMKLDPTLVMAVVTVESHWNTHARSWAGAVGLGQLMPDTARNLGVDPTSGRSNLKGLTMYLHKLLGIFSASREPIRLAIAGYNAGPLAVEHAHGIPPYAETQRYVVKVMSTWHHFKAHLPSSPSALQVQQQLNAVDTVAVEQSSYWGAPPAP